MPKCSVCDREFKNDLAMKIHFGKQHRRKRRANVAGKAAAQPGRPPIAAPAGLDVRSLNIEQLIGLKHEVDARVRQVIKRLRMAKMRV